MTPEQQATLEVELEDLRHQSRVLADLIKNIRWIGAKIVGRNPGSSHMACIPFQSLALETIHYLGKQEETSYEVEGSGDIEQHE